MESSILGSISNALESKVGKMLFAATVAFGVGSALISHNNYNAELEARYRSMQSRYNSVVNKADLNQDGVLQNTEIAELLRRLGKEYKVPENAPVRVSYSLDSDSEIITSNFNDTVEISLGIEDLERLAYGQ